MRITTAMVYGRLQGDLGRTMERVYQAQQQVSTGRRFERLADDPLGATEVLRSLTQLRAVAQYRRNVTAVRSRLSAEEAVVNQVADLLDTARETALTQASANASAATRAISADDIQSLLDQAAALGNTALGNEYLFGGTVVTAAPFARDPASPAGVTNYVYNGNAGATAARRVDLGPGRAIQVNTDGDQLLVSSGVLSTLQSLRDALRANDVPGINAATDALKTVQDTIQLRLADVGGRGRDVDAAEAQLTSLQSLTEDRQSEAWNIPAETAVTSFAAAQSSMQSALLAATKVFNLNLTDYLR